MNNKTRFRTHYQNLQVSEKATDSVIRAAHKALLQKWHPDKNPDDRKKAEQVTRIINKAFRVLSDPDLRRRHDRWIAEQRSGGSYAKTERSEKNRKGEGTQDVDQLLFTAAAEGTPKDVQDALKNGAKVNAESDNGMTPLMIAGRHNPNAETARILIEYGAHIDEQDSAGVTALMYAAGYNSPTVVEELLGWGARVDLESKSGHTAADWASKNSLINCSDGAVVYSRLRGVRTGQGQVRRLFGVYKHPIRGLEAVKQGFSWPGFFFGVFWAFFKRMWGVGIAIVGAMLLIEFVVVEYTRSSDQRISSGVLLSFAYFALYLTIGIKGNQWRRANLLNRGFAYVATLEATTPREAMQAAARDEN